MLRRQKACETRRRPAAVPGCRSGRRAATTPLLRLAALIAGGILLAVVLVVWVNSCRSDAKKAQYRDYMAEVDKIGKDSAQVGTRAEPAHLLLRDPARASSRRSSRACARPQSQTVARAEALDPPGALRAQQESMVEALQLRVSGLAGLESAFGQITGAENNDEAGTRLAEQSARLIAGDVLWDDLFKARRRT